MTLTRTGPVTALHPAPAEKTSAGKIHDAAAQFESLLIGGMLRSVRESGGGWMGSEDQSADSVIEMAEQNLARLLAANGGLGLAKLVTQGLAAGPPAGQPSLEPSSSAIRKAYSGGI